MKSASISEAKNRLSAYIDRVRRGETVVITDRGKPVARLAPLVPLLVRQSVTDSVQAIRAGDRPLEFVCLDQRLRQGAEREGFALLPAPATEEESVT